jgi:hypothetical protein
VILQSCWQLFLLNKYNILSRSRNIEKSDVDITIVDYTICEFVLKQAELSLIILPFYDDKTHFTPETTSFPSLDMTDMSFFSNLIMA